MWHDIVSQVVVIIQRSLGRQSRARIFLHRFYEQIFTYRLHICVRRIRTHTHIGRDRYIGHHLSIRLGRWLKTEKKTRETIRYDYKHILNKILCLIVRKTDSFDRVNAAILYTLIIIPCRACGIIIIMYNVLYKIGALTITAVFAGVTLSTSANRSLTSSAVQTRILASVPRCHCIRIDGCGSDSGA